MTTESHCCRVDVTLIIDSWHQVAGDTQESVCGLPYIRTSWLMDPGSRARVSRDARAKRMESRDRAFLHPLALALALVGTWSALPGSWSPLAPARASGPADGPCADV